MRNMNRPPVATQERLFPIVEIDLNISEYEIAIIGTAKKLLSAQRDEVLDGCEGNFISRWRSKRELKKYFEERQQHLDQLERTAEIIGDGLTPSFYHSLKEASGESSLLTRAENELQNSD